MQSNSEKMYSRDTICAIATATGGALGIIRISGNEALGITDKIFTPTGKDKRPLAERQPYTIVFGKITDKENGGETVDEVLVSLFRAPHSYTGEDSVEISCHGSEYILNRIMQLLIDNGCAPAGPGEYTQRAFLNGKMDLSQAEAVADLIASQSEASHRIAFNQMKGTFSSELARLREELLHITSLLELELDFSDHEELEFANRDEIKDIAVKIQSVITGLIASFKVGNAIKNGVPVAIVGETNAGKSTLLNRLVGEDRAIVSDIHGTTRDVIEETTNIGGTIFRFIDTAGIRETKDEIESIGIERTINKISRADIILLTVDSTIPTEHYAELFSTVLPLCKGKHLIIVYNKCDLISAGKPQPHIAIPTEIRNTLSSLCETRISAKSGDGIATLLDTLRQISSSDTSSTNGVIISNARHLSILRLASSDITRVIEGLDTSLPSDLISQDLRNCIYHLGEITGGEINTDEVLGNIFKNFCIGK